MRVIQLKNVVISDLLPAGFEIENPKIATREKVDLDKGENYIFPDYIERRDDRFLIFCDIEEGLNRYKYTVRAVTKGKFTLPAIYAECMYDSTFKSINGAGEISIK